MLFDDGAHTGALLLQHVRFGEQLVEGDGLAARPAMLWAADDDDLVPGERPDDDLALMREGADDMSAGRMCSPGPVEEPTEILPPISSPRLPISVRARSFSSSIERARR
jgi:hypothetical protein